MKRFSLYDVLTGLLTLGCTLLCGCGGSGSGPSSSSGGTLNFFANFTPGTGSGPTGLSEVIQVTSLTGTVLQTQTVSSNGINQTPKQVVFSNLPNQNLLVHATLYSGTKGAGTAVGTLDSSIVGSNTNNLVAVMAQPVSTVVVGPALSSLQLGSSQKFVASAEDSLNEVVFVAAAPVWNLGSGGSSVGSISSQGLFTGSGVGMTTVTASLASLDGSAQVTVTSVIPGSWTIMLYLNSANDLDAYSLQNIQQIEQIAQTATSPTRMVIEWKLTPNAGIDVPKHPFYGTRRYLAVQNNLAFLQDLGTNVDMGTASTLKSFVSWSAANYPAQHYMLILWDHGNGWFMNNAVPHAPKWRGISYDEETGNHIDVNQLAQAISPVHLDILSFDACQMQQLETMDQVSGVANYMVCSEDNTPGPGYPYNVSFAQFYSNPGGATPTLAKGIVDGFINSYDGDPDYNLTPLSHSVVDLSKVGSVVTALNTFTSSLLTTGSSIGPVTSSVRNSLINYAAGDGYNYYDLGAIGQSFVTANPNASVVQASSSLVSAEQAAVVYSRTDGHSPNSTGIAIEFGSSTLFNSYATAYNTLLLAQQTKWAQFLANASDNP